MQANNPIAAIALAGLLATAPAGAALVTYNFQFDNSDNGTVTAPIVGTGSMSFDDPGTGTFNFFSLSGLSLSFDFGATSFDLGDIVTTVGTLVAISGTAGTRSLVFTGTGNGPYGGSLDFASYVMSFAPTGAEGIYHIVSSGVGNYAATESVPVPATLALLLGGIAGLRLARRRTEV